MEKVTRKALEELLKDAAASEKEEVRVAAQHLKEGLDVFYNDGKEELCAVIVPYVEQQEEQPEESGRILTEEEFNLFFGPDVYAD